ncbi:hypothetical protein MBAV_001130 [Candidatus Magnetobacterium bavaricum]|uniref:Uncharacterized protein n=1 Tax=Candidatus Magnetobacterium bavaricum TaxID=29290 RepID=A0A0F3GXP7_9BACT|nr:hypothetical protein MBAV_001130 [Candidatus Magnetobacterium bavaricum]
MLIRFSPPVRIIRSTGSISLVSRLDSKTDSSTLQRSTPLWASFFTVRTISSLPP